MDMKKHLFCIFTTSKYNREYQSAYFSISHIIECAEDICSKSGETFEDLAGVEWVEDKNENLVPTRPLTDEEIFSIACEQWRKDGLEFEWYETEKDFYDRCECLGIENDEQVRGLLDTFNVHQ